MAKKRRRRGKSVPSEEEKEEDEEDEEMEKADAMAKKRRRRGKKDEKKAADDGAAGDLVGEDGGGDGDGDGGESETSPSSASAAGGFVKPLFKNPSTPLAAAYEARNEAHSRRMRAALPVVEARRKLEEALAAERSAVAELEATTQNVFDLELAEPCRWNDMFSELTKFVEENGHCRVPAARYFKKEDETKMKKLSIWVSKQKAGIGSIRRAPHRVKALEGLGVVRTKGFEDRWAKRFAQLKEFREEHGHCRVSRDDNKELNDWIRDQRKRYMALKAGKSTAMTEERIKDLESIGMVWNAIDQRGPGHLHSEERWWLWFNKLKEYKQEHGHVKLPPEPKCPPDSELHPLWKWVRQQKQNHRKGRMGMTPQRLEALRDIGLVMPEDKEEKWARRLGLLVDFRERHGHCRVPAKYEEDPNLFIWVKNLKASLSKLNRGLHDKKLTPERLEMLRDAGIDFRSCC